MSTSAVSAQSSIQDLTLQIMNQFDTDKSGELSASEFSSVLSALLGNTSGTVPATMTVPPASPSGAAPSGLPKSEMSGFNYDKIADTSHQTSKYQFARVAWNYDLSSVNSKESAQALLESMVPDLQAAGLNVTAVDTDKIQVSDEYGTYWVDVIRDYDGPNHAFQWLTEDSGTATASQAAVPSSETALARQSTSAIGGAEQANARSVLAAVGPGTERDAHRAYAGQDRRDERRTERTDRRDERHSMPVERRARA